MSENEANPAQESSVVEVEQQGGVTLAAVNAEEIDSRNADTVSAELQKLVSDNCRIILDLRKVRYLYSDALGKLVSLNGKVKNHTGKLGLCNLSDDAYEVIATTGLTRVFSIYDSRTEALEGLQG